MQGRLRARQLSQLKPKFDPERSLIAASPTRARILCLTGLMVLSRVGTAGGPPDFGLENTPARGQDAANHRSRPRGALAKDHGND